MDIRTVEIKDCLAWRYFIDVSTVWKMKVKMAEMTVFADSHRKHFDIRFRDLRPSTKNLGFFSVGQASFSIRHNSNYYVLVVGGRGGEEDPILVDKSLWDSKSDTDNPRLLSFHSPMLPSCWCSEKKSLKNASLSHQRVYLGTSERLSVFITYLLMRMAGWYLSEWFI